MVHVHGTRVQQMSARTRGVPLEALRKLKRQLSTVVYRRLLADQVVRGGQVETRPKSA